MSLQPTFFICNGGNITEWERWVESWVLTLMQWWIRRVVDINTCTWIRWFTSFLPWANIYWAFAICLTVWVRGDKMENKADEVPDLLQFTMWICGMLIQYKYLFLFSTTSRVLDSQIPMDIPKSFPAGKCCSFHAVSLLVQRSQVSDAESSDVMAWCHQATSSFCWYKGV